MSRTRLRRGVGGLSSNEGRYRFVLRFQWPETNRLVLCNGDGGLRHNRGDAHINVPSVTVTGGVASFSKRAVVVGVSWLVAGNEILIAHGSGC